jgi:hypothetical protein
MQRLAAETEVALSRVAVRGRQIRNEPTKMPLKTMLPLSDDQMAKEIPEPDSLGG